MIYYENQDIFLFRLLQEKREHAISRLFGDISRISRDNVWIPGHQPLINWWFSVPKTQEIGIGATVIIESTLIRKQASRKQVENDDYQNLININKIQ